MHYFFNPSNCFRNAKMKTFALCWVNFQHRARASPGHAAIGATAVKHQKETRCSVFPQRLTSWPKQPNFWSQTSHWIRIIYHSYEQIYAPCYCFAAWKFIYLFNGLTFSNFIIYLTGWCRIVWPDRLTLIIWNASYSLTCYRCFEDKVKIPYQISTRAFASFAL